MQGDQFDESRATIDREDDFLWRRAPLRLEAEPIRDAMLAVSGLLDGWMYGPGSLDPMMQRRSVYFFIKRSQLIPTLMLFDWPEHLVSIGQRSETTTASQALLFLNSPLGHASAEGFAGRLPAEESQGSDAIGQAYRIAFGRPPTPAEAQLAAQFLGRQTALYERAGQSHPHRRALVDFCQSLMGSSEFIYIP
jgi:hypothetical protein